MLSTPQIRALLIELNRQQPRMLRLLGRFVRAESPSVDKAAVDRFAELVAAEWRARGARVKLLRQRERGNHVRAQLVPTARPAGRQILVLGHLDTVYARGTLLRMPFRIARGHAWGPGVFDMKGGLVMALFAVDALRRTGIELRRRVVFLWVSDEEIESESSFKIVQQEARRSDAVLVLEPASGREGRLKTARKGVGTVELVVRGRAAHAGLDPELGVNAVQELALQIARIAKWNEPRRGIGVQVTLVEGGERSNVIPDYARALVDVRASDTSEMRKLESQFRRLRPILPGATLEIHGGFSRPPMERRRSRTLFRHAQWLAGQLGLRLDECSSGGGSDGNLTAALGIPTLDGLGAVGEGAHSPRENIVIRALPERAALLASLLATL